MNACKMAIRAERINRAYYNGPCFFSHFGQTNKDINAWYLSLFKNHNEGQQTTEKNFEHISDNWETVRVKQL